MYLKNKQANFWITIFVVQAVPTQSTAGLWPTRLKDRLGISNLEHLARRRLVARSPQDSYLPVPQAGWVPAGEGLSMPMEVAHAQFLPLGEALVGEFKTRPIKNAWARIKNRTILKNFLFCPGDPTGTTCYYKMDCPAGMKSIDYEVVAACSVARDNDTFVRTSILWMRCMSLHRLPLLYNTLLTKFRYMVWSSSVHSRE
jgi:hypothetical protein